MKRFISNKTKFVSSRFSIRYSALIAASLASVISMASLSACGGSSEPEQKTFELFMQAQGVAIGDTGGSCASEMPTFASRQRWFEQEILQKELKLKVISSECHYLPKVDAKPGGGLCLAEIRYLIAAEGAVQNYLDTAIYKDSKRTYAPEGQLEFFNVVMFDWGSSNSQIVGIASNTQVAFPPSFTPSYVSCGNG